MIAKTLLDEGARVLVHGMTQEQAEQAVATLGGGTPVWGDIVSTEGAQQLL
ncbi:MAG: oxidoreductase, partial [Proteobacteria bacterium]|nr:oxidoreductase [Pseudomonadota bacterium]